MLFRDPPTNVLCPTEMSKLASRRSEINCPKKPKRGEIGILKRYCFKAKGITANSYWICGSFCTRVMLKLIRGNDEREAIG